MEATAHVQTLVRAKLNGVVPGVLQVLYTYLSYIHTNRIIALVEQCPQHCLKTFAFFSLLQENYLVSFSFGILLCTNSLMRKKNNKETTKKQTNKQTNIDYFDVNPIVCHVTPLNFLIKCTTGIHRDISIYILLCIKLSWSNVSSSVHFNYFTTLTLFQPYALDIHFVQMEALV